MATAAETSLFQVVAIAVGQRLADQLPAHINVEAHRSLRVLDILRPAGDALPVDAIDLAAPAKPGLLGLEPGALRNMPARRLDLLAILAARCAVAGDRPLLIRVKRGEFVGVLYYETVTDYIQQMNAAAQEALDDKEVDSGGEI